MVPDDDYLASSNQNKSISFFKELFTTEELKKHIEFFDPINIEQRITSGGFKSKVNRETLYNILKLEQEEDAEKLSHCLYNLVGPNFLYEVRGSKPNDINSKTLRYEIFKKSIEKNRFSFDDLNKQIKTLSIPHNSGIANLEELKEKTNEQSTLGKQSQRWQELMLELLSHELPDEAVEKPQTETGYIPAHFTVPPAKKLRPLHDYQIYAGKQILDKIQSEKGTRKRLLISIPTGAGKTRLVAESLIDWINAGKYSKDDNMCKSKYMIWIAQSRELCEQTISQFEEIYSKKGNSTLDIFRFTGDYDITLESILNDKPKNYGLIVGTIDKFYEVIPNKPKIKSNLDPDDPQYEQAVNRSEIPKLFYNNFEFGKLRGLTSCITIDEAHKGITSQYTAVLRGFGFNFNFTTDEKNLNENGITLVGLTATAFRGTGLEPSREIKLIKPFMKEITVVHLDQIKNRITYPAICAVCKKPLPENELILQSTSNEKIIWHKNEQKISSATDSLYNRFSKPEIPRIHEFEENTKPTAIITCGEKFTANYPIRISGEKSYDSLGEIQKYSWDIKKISELVEVFGIQKKTDIEIPTQNDQTIVVELPQSGRYRIILTVENFDGIPGSVSKIIQAVPQENSEKDDDMRNIIQILIKRNILCEVYHSFVSIKEEYVLTSKTMATRQTELLPRVAQNQERNQKIINIIQYLLEKPKNKRKKILVFSCNIGHARLLSMWLNMKGITADYVDSKLDSSRNILKIKKFREKSEIGGKVLINTNMLTTGFDVPDVDCVIMGRPVMSTVEYTQMIGRGMRGTRMRGTKNVWIVDFDDQVQRSEKMVMQVIPLGWKSMAYDNLGSSIWRRIEEEFEDDGKTTLNLDNIEKIEHEKNLETNPSVAAIPESQVTPTPAEENKLLSEISDPWIQFIESQKTDPISLELVSFIASKYNTKHEMDISTITDLRKIVKRVIGHQKSLNNEKINMIYNSYDPTTIDILKKMFTDSKEKIQKTNLIQFNTADIIIIQKPIKDTQKIINLCDEYIGSLDLMKNILYQKELNKPKISPDDQLLQEFTRITYNVLGFIPNEKRFKEHISNELYTFLITNHITYERWRKEIKINDHILRIQARNQCLDKVIEIINRTKKNPTREILESEIVKFDESIIKNFFQFETFFNIVKDIFESVKNATKNLDFTQIDQDYQYMKNMNNFEPSTEEILRYSKIGIGQYVKYCGNVANFVQIRELSTDKIDGTNYSIREHLEKLKVSFLNIKKYLNHIPTEVELRLHSRDSDSGYSQIIEYLWFDSYFEFLDFLCEDPSKIGIPIDEQSKCSKEEMIKESKKYVEQNTVRSLFNKILIENSEIKYNINFGGVDQFIEIIFPSNKVMMKKIWFDMKKDFKRNL